MIDIILAIIGGAIAFGSCALELAPSVKTGPIEIKVALAALCVMGVIILNAAL